MKIQENFFKLIAIGNFNPAILTHDFLVSKCKISCLEEPVISQKTPIASKISYKTFSFSLDLIKLELEEKSFSSPKSLGVFKKYISILAFTPISLVGINFNLTIISDTPQENQNKINFLMDEKRIISCFKSKEARIISDWVYSDKEEKKINSRNYLMSLNKTNRYNLKFEKIKEAEFTINLNYEINYQDNFDEIIKDYENIQEKYKNLLTLIEKGGS